MRCPNCAKMVSYDTEAEPELEGDVTYNGNRFEAQVRRSLNCGECGTELKAATLDIEGEISTEKSVCSVEGGEHSWEDDGNVDLSPTDRYVDTDAKGKKITKQRYMKHMYGAELTVNVTCSECQAVGTASGTGEEQAGAFDEQV